MLGALGFGGVAGWWLLMVSASTRATSVWWCAVLAVGVMDGAALVAGGERAASWTALGVCLGGSAHLLFRLAVRGLLTPKG